MLLVSLLAGCSAAPSAGTTQEDGAAGSVFSRPAEAAGEETPEIPEEETPPADSGEAMAPAGAEEGAQTRPSAAEPGGSEAPGGQATTPAAEETAARPTTRESARPTTKATTRATAEATTKKTVQATAATTRKTTARPTSPSTTQATDQTASDLLARYESEVVRLVNQERAKQGLSALTVISGLEATADVRAREIVQKFSHTRPDGSDCFTAFPGSSAYPDRISAMAENIAAGQSTPAEVMNAWMNSEGHRKNILDETLRYIGVGCYESGGRYYWVQVFAG